MYLTRMHLNRRLRTAQRLLSSPQRIHAAVEDCFPPGALAATGGRTLWRIDPADHGEALLIASPIQPDMRHLVEQAGWQTDSAWETRPYTPLLESLAEGQQWRFRLTANPIHAARKGDWADTKPCAITGAKRQEEWLQKRCEGMGFTIPDGPEESHQLAVKSQRTLRFNRESRQVKIATVTYEGILAVTEPNLLSTAMTTGIGRAKAYGCGMLTIAPIEKR
jgi:CRISPR system Cascade subunit CasE